MERRELTVMAVTRLSSGVCVACVDEDRRWVRPTRVQPKGWHQLEVRDLYDARGRLVVQPGNVVVWPLGKAVPCDVHREDVRALGAPELVGRTSQRSFLVLCEQLQEVELRAFLQSEDRSLTIVQPDAIEVARFAVKDGALDARMTFLCEGERHNYSVTDLAWRATGRRWLRSLGVQTLVLAGEELAQRTQLGVRLLAVGRGQRWEGHCHDDAGEFWPFIISVISYPANREPVDYSNL